MTPYPKGKLVVIDLQLKDQLKFGKVSNDLLYEIGHIIEVSYFKQEKCDSYKVMFPNGESHWFLEHEII